MTLFNLNNHNSDVETQIGMQTIGACSDKKIVSKKYRGTSLLMWYFLDLLDGLKGRTINVFSISGLRNIMKVNLFFILLFICSTCYSSIGTDWLISQANSNGGINSPNAITHDFAATTETLITLDVLGESDSVEIPNAIQYLQTNLSTDSVNLCLTLLAQDKVGIINPELLTEIESRIQSDGGVSPYKNYQSNLLDSLYTLQVLLKLKPQSDNILPLILYIKAAQLPDGGFKLHLDETTSVYLSSLASLSLQLAQNQFDVVDEITAVSQYLLQKRNLTNASAADYQTWASSWQTATALLALINVDIGQSEYQIAIDKLFNEQDVNGSWNDDVYTTALALRVKALIEGTIFVPPDNPSEIFGTIVDEFNNQIINNATITINTNPQRTTQSVITGEFQFTDLQSGSYQLTIAATGYQELSVDIGIEESQILNLGMIKLFKNPTISLLKGLITDSDTAQPLENAQINIIETATSITIQTQTNIYGQYEVEVNPVEITIEISLAGYQSVTATTTVIAGQIINFSVALLLNGNPPATLTQLFGKIVDAQTSTPIEEVEVSIVNGSITQTDIDGMFEFSDLTPETIAINITKQGYYPLAVNASLVPGMVDLGEIRLNKIVQATTITLTGTITDEITAIPLADVSILNSSTGIITQTDINGFYQIENISDLSFSLTMTKSGYFNKSITLDVTDFGETEYNTTLIPIEPSDLEILSMISGRDTYYSNEEVEIELFLKNSGNTTIGTRLHIKVVNDFGDIILDEPVMNIPIGGDPQNALEYVLANTQREVEVPWFTRYYPATDYTITITALHEQSNQVYDEKSMLITILPTQSVGGLVQFDPPVMQFDPNREVNVSATISNTGNLITGDFEITANVTLAAKAQNNSDNSIITTVIPSPFTDDTIYGMETRNDGKVLMAAQEKIILFDPKTNSYSEFASGFNDIKDISINSDNGLIYVINRGSEITELDSDGTLLQVFDTGLVSYWRIEALANGKVLFTSSSGLHELIPATGQIRTISQNNLNSPAGIAIANNGDIYVADETNGSIFVFNGTSLSLFIDGLDRPRGICFDTDGSLLVAQWDLGNLIRIEMDKTVSIITEDLTTPFDVKLAADGSYIVSLWSDHSIYRVQPNGDKVQLVAETISAPSIIEHDSLGNYYIYNFSSSKISYHKTDGSVSHLANTYTSVTDLLVDQNDTLYVLRSNELLKQNTQGDFDQIAIAETSYRKISLTDTINELAVIDGSELKIINQSGSVINNLWIPSGELRGFTANQNTVDVINYQSSSKLQTIDSNYNIQKSNNNFVLPYAYFSDANNKYIAEYVTKKVFKIDGLNNTTEYLTLENRAYQMIVMPNGNIIYGINNTAELYINDGTSESEYMTLPFPINRYSRMILDDFGVVWISSGSFNKGIFKINTNTMETQHLHLSIDSTEVRYYYGITPDSTGGIYLGSDRTIYHYNGINTTEVVIQTEIPNIRIYNLAYLNNQLWFADRRGDNLFIIDLLGNLIKETSIAGSLTNVLNDGNSLLLATNEHILKYNKQLNTLPEIVIRGRYLGINHYDTNNLVLNQNSRSYIYNKTTEEQRLLANEIVSNLSVYNNIITAVHGATNKIMDFDFNGNTLDSKIGVINPSGLTINNSGKIYNSSRYGIIELRNDGFGDYFAPSASNQYIASDDEYLYSTRNSTSVFRYNQTDGARSIISTAPSYRSLQAIALDSNSNIITVSPLGIIKIDQSGVAEKLTSTLNKIVDIESKADGSIYIATAQIGVSDIFQLTATDSIVNFPFPISLPNKLNTISIVNDDLLLSFTSAQESIKRINMLGEIEEFANAFSDNSVSENIVALDANTILATEQLSSNPRLLRLNIVDNNESGLQIGDSIYTATIQQTSLEVQSSPQILDFGNVLLPIAGNYTVNLTTDNQDVDFHLSNSVSAAALASGNISLSTQEVLPGDNVVAVNLSLESIDAQSVVEIRTDQLHEITSTNIHYKSFIVNEDGDFFGLTSNQVRRINHNTGIEQTIFDSEPIRDIRINKQGDIYLLTSTSPTNIYQISTEGNILDTIIAPARFNFIDLDQEGNLYAFFNRDGVYKYSQSSSSWEQLFTWSGGSVITFEIGDTGNFYLGGFSTINQVSRDGTIRQTVLDGFRMENEAYNKEVMCFDNLLLAPMTIDDFPSLSGEEHALVHYDPNTGIPRLVFDANALGIGIIDNDSMHYDRFNNRILMSTDYSQYGIFSIPAFCGSMTVQAHIRTRADVDIQLDTDTPVPQSIIQYPDGTAEYIWNFEDVGMDSTNLPLTANINNMQEGETRPIFAAAYLQFTNTLIPDQDLQIPLEIPTVHASSAKELILALDNTQYPSDTDVNITDTVINNSNVSFSGVIVQHIATEQGVFVESLSDVSVSNLAAGTQISLPALWNTAYYFAGNYKVVSRLTDENDVEQDTQEQLFSIIPDQINGSIASIAITSDKPVYSSIDQVILSTSVSNLASNANLDNTRAQVLLSQPDNMIVFQNISEVNSLAPHGSQNWQHNVSFDKVPIGTYLATLNLLDENDVIVASAIANLEVVRNNQQFIAGRVTVLLSQVDTLTDNTCTYNLQNTDIEPIINVKVHQILVDLVTQSIILDDIVVINLASNATWSNDQFIETLNLPTNAYACILRTEIDGTLQTRGTAVFNVTGFNRITGYIWDDNNANGVQDGLEARLANAQLRLLDSNSNEIEIINTLIDGSYEFTPIADGVYSIEVLESGILTGYQLTTSNNPITFTLNSNNVENNFGYQSHNSSITGFVYSDSNGNGIKDVNETLIENVSIALNDQNGIFLQGINTDSNGYYEFDQLFASTYQIEVTDTLLVLNNANLTTSNQPYQITLIANQVDNNPSFGYQYHDAIISGIVFDDINGDGILDNQEPLFANVTVDLVSAQLNLTTITDSNGVYSFQQLAAADYQITVTDQTNILNGYQLTTANQPFAISLENHQNNNTGIFGYQAHLSTVTGLVFKDDNGNGIKDATEASYTNVSVELTGLTTNMQTTTDINGIYNFTQLTTGDYTLIVTDNNSILANTELTTSNQPYTFSLATLATESNGIFGYQLQNSAIAGTIYTDTNGNGQQENTETGIQGVTLDLVDNTNNTVITTITSQIDGVYQFNQLIAGDYKVVITDTNTILTHSQLTTANMPFSTLLSANEQLTNINFGYQSTVSGISGLVFNDINGNGIQDIGENGLENISIELLQDNTALLTINTTATGIYLFESLDVGQYSVSVTDGNNILTQAQLTTSNQPYAINLSENEQHTGGIFGYQFYRSTLELEIFSDENGNGIKDLAEPGIGQVTADITHNNTLVNSDVSSANGIIQFNNLSAGDYQITITDDNNILNNHQLTTNNLPLTITLGDNETNTNTSFGYQLTNSTIFGVVFNDSNGNGLQELNEDVFANISIELYQNNELLTTITTNMDGIYNIDKLPSGQYTLIVTDSNNLLNQTELTTANQPYIINLPDNVTHSNGNFGYQHHNSSIEIEIYNDTNGDGIKNNNEPGIPQVTVNISQDNITVNSSTSDANGHIMVNSLTSGIYQITVNDSNNILDDYNLTTNNLPLEITLAENQTNTAGLFGFQLTNSSVSGIVFNDINGDGIRQSSEHGLANVTLLMDGLTVATNAIGQFNYPQLNAGDYELTVTDQNQILTSATLTSNNLPYTINLQTSEALDNIQFAYQFSQSSITGTIFNDANGDGIQQNNELGLNNVSLNLMIDTQLISTVHSNTNGIYQFTNLVPGYYSVIITDSANELAQSQLTTANQPYELFLGDNQQHSAGNFGYRFTNVSINIIIFDDINANGIQEINEIGIDNVTVDLIQSHQVIHQATSTQNGAVSFTQLPTDTYTVVVTDTNNELTSYQLTTSNQPYTTTLTQGQQYNIIFGYQDSQANITGIIWHDSNANATIDNQEQAINGIKIELRNSNNDLLDEVTTSLSGVYHFDNREAGEYLLHIPEQNIIQNWQLTTNNQPHQLTLLDNENYNQNFGYRSLNNTITGHVFKDENGNGIKEAEDYGMENMILHIYQQQATTQPLQTVTTDTQGNYQITSLPIGQYYIHAIVPASYRISQQGYDSDFIPATANTPLFDLATNSTMDFSLGLTQTTNAILNQPYGIKSSQSINSNTVRWKMRWYNNQNNAPLNILVKDDIAQGSHYKPSTLKCNVHGQSIITQCEMLNANTTVSVLATITNNSPADFISIQFDVILSEGVQQIENQGYAYWDANANGLLTDEINNNQIPVLTFDETNQNQQPTIGYPIALIPLLKSWQLILLMLLIIFITFKYNYHTRKGVHS